MAMVLTLKFQSKCPKATKYIDRRKRNCSTEVNDRRKGKYCEKGSPGKSTESHTITFKCHL